MFPYYPNMLQRNEIVRVSGEPGARAYPLPPNSEMLMLDQSAPIVWLATTDSGGYKTLTAFDIKQHLPEEATQKSLESRIRKLEEIICESNNKQIKPHKSSSDINVS